MLQTGRAPLRIGRLPMLVADTAIHPLLSAHFSPLPEKKMRRTRLGRQILPVKVTGNASNGPFKKKNQDHSNKGHIFTMEALGALLGGIVTGLRRSVRPRGNFWGPHSIIGFAVLALTLVYFSYLLDPQLNFYPFGAPRIVDVQRHFGIVGYRLLLWSTVVLSTLGLLRLPEKDPEVRTNFFRFQLGAAIYASLAIETSLSRQAATIDVFSGFGQVGFFAVTACDAVIALYWMYTIVAVSQEDAGVVAGVQRRAPTLAFAALIGPFMGASGLLVPPLFAFFAGRAANEAFLAAQPGIEAATLNATVGLILIGNIAVFCLTATRRRWLTNEQALPIVLCSFALGFYDLLAYASDETRRAALDVLNANAYKMHLPEAFLVVAIAVLAAALSQPTQDDSADSRQ